MKNAQILFFIFILILLSGHDSNAQNTRKKLELGINPFVYYIIPSTNGIEYAVSDGNTRLQYKNLRSAFWFRDDMNVEIGFGRGIYESKFKFTDWRYNVQIGKTFDPFKSQRIKLLVGVDYSHNQGKRKGPDSRYNSTDNYLVGRFFPGIIWNVSSKFRLELKIGELYYSKSTFSDDFLHQAYSVKKAGFMYEPKAWFFFIYFRIN